jgi:DNA polymerase III subunit epsilon
MIVLGIDFETTGLDPAKHRVIEVGAVLWDTDTATPLRLYSDFCFCDDLPEMEPEALAAHGLSVQLLEAYGKPHPYVFGYLLSMSDGVSAFVGHNCIQFDRPFYLAEFARLKLQTSATPWIDTMTDLKYPASITTRKLSHLAAEHGFLNPFAHRSVFDVLTMLRIFQCYDTVAARAFAMEPMVTLQACVSFDDRQKAKDRGYRWNGETRRWLKSLRASEALKEQTEAGFKVLEITNA